MTGLYKSYHEETGINMESYRVQTPVIIKNSRREVL